MKMYRVNYLLICFAIILQSCNGQTTAKKEIHNKEFNWTITIPENFENVDTEEWDRLQNKGADAIEQTYGEKVVNHSKTIFVFKSDQFNYFNSNYQPFDIAVDGNYLKSFKNVNTVIYETFKAQMPEVKIDSTSTIEKIDNLDFHSFRMKAEYPNKMVLNFIMFSRLFDNKEFTIHIIYADPRKGQQMLDAWKQSKFAK